MEIRQYHTDVVVIGGGLAAIVAAIELLEHGKHVILLERGGHKQLGGLAKVSFGGVFVVDSPEQRRGGIQDSPLLAERDWFSYAEFKKEDFWPEQWAKIYVRRCLSDVYFWLKERSIRFLPVVHWAERGLFVPGNSVPRFHLIWGTGYGLVTTLLHVLQHHPNKHRLQLLLSHRAQGLLVQNGKVIGCNGLSEEKHSFAVYAEATLIASGGIAGNEEKVRENWFKAWGTPPRILLNGSHPFASGELHDAVKGIGGKVARLDRMWNYAAGIHHPKPQFSNQGLSLVPPKSALWINAEGVRVSNPPLVAGFDTRFLVERITHQPGQFSWQIMNWKIACKELAVSGAEFNEAIRDKKWVAFLKTLLFGNPKLVRHLLNSCEDFVSADSLEELVSKMNKINGKFTMDTARLKHEIQSYDERILRGKRFWNDDQLRRIGQLRNYRGERIRTCHFQTILDKKASPLIAVRLFILSRKNLGGIETNLQCQVLNENNEVIPGLYAAGEAAGFGGGGIHGFRSLEGTFLGGCILTGRVAARAIVGKEVNP